MSGGGPKGAFEAGAIYHLVVHRECDFHEFSGSSVGALNAVFLAQAAPSPEWAKSQANLAAQAEGLVSLWQSVKGPRSIMKSRRMATVRFGLFGLENLNDFEPLKQLIDSKISAEKLMNGRPVRVGVVSFWDGGYREIVSQPQANALEDRKFLEYLYASAVPPLYGRLPRIAEETDGDDPKQWQQFTDGGMRHITPVVSYFKTCGTAEAENQKQGCNSDFVAPLHEPVQQLFVIVTSPYSRYSDLLPLTDARCCRPGSRQMTDGRKILGRTLALLDDSSYRWDLDFLLFANDMLRWRAQAYRDLTMGLTLDGNDLRRRFLDTKGFAVESYNFDPVDPGGPSLPYDVGLVAPEKEYAEISHLMTFTPPLIQEQLYCGCVASDRMMQSDFGQPSLSEKCADRFPPLSKLGKKKETVQKWSQDVCRKGSDTTTQRRFGE